jgi:hypothetical protein
MRRAWLLAAGFLSASAAAAHPGIGIVMDPGGNVFYTDLAQVWRLAPDGSKAVAVADVHTHELCLDAAGNLYGEHVWYEGEASDRWGYFVWRRSPDGGVERIVPPTSGFRHDYSLVRDARGNMYWGERERGQIRKRTPFGAVAVHARIAFRDLRWMTATADGVLFLIDDGALLRVAGDGRVTTLVGDLRETGLLSVVGRRHSLMGLWTDRADHRRPGGAGRGALGAREPAAGRRARGAGRAGRRAAEFLRRVIDCCPY